jgi:hypothetical protein
VTAVEANPDTAGYLRSNFKGDLKLIARPFEEADLGDVGDFDLAVAATSFHWVDQAHGWPNLKAAPVHRNLCLGTARMRWSARPEPEIAWRAPGSVPRSARGLAGR